MKNSIVLFIILFTHVVSFGQNYDNWCGTAERMNKMMADPEKAAVLVQDELIRQQEATENQVHQKGMIFKIPIVFHVLHNGGSENVSEEQIFNALDVINRDFRALNADTAQVDSLFKPLIGDVEIEFVLAHKAPDGSCFPGYTRTKSPTTHQGDDGFAQVNAVRNGNNVYQGNWPSNKYLNVYVIADAGGAGGYTYLPNNWNNYDMSNGIWILDTQFGEIGTSNLIAGRSLTHECGHWFNLKHTWGNSNTPGLASNCDEDDGVDDTPLCKGVQGCAINSNSCDDTNDPNNFSSWTFDAKDNVQNYMDYALSCQSMFTLGQVNRMRTAAQSTIGGRSNLWTAQNLQDTGADEPDYLCSADFVVNKTTVCMGDSIAFTDFSYNLVNGWQWSFQGGNPSTSTQENPVVTYNTPGLYEVSLTSTDGTNSDTETRTNYIRVLSPSGGVPFLETFENYSTLNNILEWEIVNDYGNAFELETTTGHTGTKCARLNNYGEPQGTIDELISSPLDLTNDTNGVALSFRYAYKHRNGSDDDYLRVYITKDCGADWGIRKTMHGFIFDNGTQSSPYTPSSQSDWTTIHITNIDSSYWVDNFRYKFVFQAGGGNNFYLDNINVYHGNPSDALIVGIDEIMQGSISQFRIYPNPVEDELTVDFDVTNSQKADLVVTDISGKQIARHSLFANEGHNKAYISTSALRSGVYLITIAANGYEDTKRFIVK